ncbi:MAG: hypothetical protein K0B81_05560 [Candidatus Cloacimonetes bacterium]|nr:hypothetical protein [Candidatus Cloacimonadota bacterium]
MKKTTLLFLIVMFSIFLLADNPTSENYVLKAHTLSSGSAFNNAPSSVNYILQGSVLGIISGDVATSANYSLLPGYYLGIDDLGELLTPTIVNIWVSSGNFFMEWSEIPRANSYKIYASDDPYSLDWGAPIAVVGVTSYSEPVSVMRRFYRIVASTELLPSRGLLRETRR